MKKLFNLLMVALMAVCFAIPAMGKAEAAKVVVLPLVILWLTTPAAKPQARFISAALFSCLIILNTNCLKTT